MTDTDRLNKRYGTIQTFFDQKGFEIYTFTFG